MLKWLFSRKSSRDVPHEIYGAVVAQSRNPQLFVEYQIPDTFDGRFEALALHLFLLSHRLKDDGDIAQSLSQEVFDTFIAEMSQALREQGVGDSRVPKNVKKMAQVFYGRVKAFEPPLEQGDVATLAYAIDRNVFVDESNLDAALEIARYMVGAAKHYAQLPMSHFLEGRVKADEFAHLYGQESKQS